MLILLEADVQMSTIHVKERRNDHPQPPQRLSDHIWLVQWPDKMTAKLFWLEIYDPKLLATPYDIQARKLVWSRWALIGVRARILDKLYGSAYSSEFEQAPIIERVLSNAVRWPQLHERGYAVFTPRLRDLIVVVISIVKIHILFISPCPWNLYSSWTKPWPGYLTNNTVSLIHSSEKRFRYGLLKRSWMLMTSIYVIKQCSKCSTALCFASAMLWWYI